MKRVTQMAKKPNGKSNIISYVALALILGYLYITKSTQIGSSNGANLNPSTTILSTTTIATPYIDNLYQNYTITVPGYQSNLVFYNYSYDTYNNYTISGDYNITFNAPYDGYLVLYIQSTTAPIFTYGFESNSNASQSVYCYGGCPTHYLTSGDVERGISGFADTPAYNSTFYHYVPVLRGINTFKFQNNNNYPIFITFSLTYVGDEYPNLAPLTINHS